MLSFPCWHLAPSLEGCQLPDAILHGKRSLLGLVAGPSSSPVLPVLLNLLSEAFQLASTDGCATGSPTSSRHACDLLSAS